MSLKKDCNESVINNILNTETTLTALRNAKETLSNGLIIAMVLKRFWKKFNLFSVYATHSSKELILLEFKTQLHCFVTPKNIVII